MTCLGFEIPLPTLRSTAAQIAISVVDWSLAAAVLFALLPHAPGLSFPQLLSAYMLAVALGLVRTCPADSACSTPPWSCCCAASCPRDVVLGCVLAYRVVYYLVPWRSHSCCSPATSCCSAATRSHAAATASRLGFELVPKVSRRWRSAAGSLLLISGATPAAPGRLDFLREILPLALLEVSHFLGSVIGVGLLLLSRALLQRLDGAYFLTLALLAAGAVASLLKGFDWEEASVLTACFVALLPCRRYFYRGSSVFRQPFSLVWTARVAARSDRDRARARALVPPPGILEASCGGSSSFGARVALAARVRRRGAAWRAIAAIAALLRPPRVRHERASAEDLSARSRSPPLRRRRARTSP